MPIYWGNGCINMLDKQRLPKKRRGSQKSLRYPQHDVSTLYGMNCFRNWDVYCKDVLTIQFCPTYRSTSQCINFFVWIISTLILPQSINLFPQLIHSSDISIDFTWYDNPISTCTNCSLSLFYKFCTAQIPNAIVAINPPNENNKMGASPPSNVVPTRSPTFLAYLLLGPEHWGQRNPAPCSSKYIPAHSARL